MMNRMTIGLNDHWKFHYGDIPEAWYKGYDDSAWEEVFLPHDWSVHQPFEKHYSSGTGYLAGGIGWYRVRFTLPESLQGKSVKVVFDGIYKNSQIWCNSYNLGKRPFGYTEIVYDITDFVQFGDRDNEISVKVVHTDLADSRWFTGSGITRKAKLVVEEPVHPSLHGTFFEVTDIEKNMAKIRLTSTLENETEEEKKGTLSWYLEQNDKKRTLLAEEEFCVKQGENAEIQANVTYEDVRLWTLEDPYLYTLITAITLDGETYEAERDTVGIRMAKFDPDQGFFLNGVETKLKGVCVHHDGGCLGAAMYKEVWLRRLLTLKAAGCNAIRTSHNPHMPELYDMCDELGLLMMDEAFDEWENPKNKWSTGHNVYPPKHEGYAEDFPQWGEQDLVTMIRRDRNHPSIILWSIGNEIDYPNDPYCHPLFETMTGNNDANKPAAERMYDRSKPNADRLTVLAKKLSAVVKKEDTLRPVTLAAAFPELTAQTGFFEPLDVVGFNYKEHLYKENHQNFPDKPFLGSENSHSYQAWRAVTDHPYISGQFLWTGIDYLGEAKGWPIHGSSAGIVDLAGFPKAGWGRRKSFWTSEPYSCILISSDDGNQAEWKSMRDYWSGAEGEPLEVRVYTNQTSAELFVNGTSQGVLTERNEQGCFLWHLPYEEGKVEALCRDESGEITTSSSLESEKTVCDLKAAIWSPAADSGKMDAVEVAQIEVTLVDENGHRVYLQDQKIRAQVVNGTLLGLENGDLADLTPYPSPIRKTREGRLIIYVKPETDTEVIISCPDLQIRKKITI